MFQLILNPAAGKGRAGRALETTRTFLRERGVEHALHLTEGPGHATELAASAPAGTVVVALGGDGTVHEVAKGLLRGGSAADATRGRTLGVVPLGSGNDFAFSLGLRPTDLNMALLRLVSGRTRMVDVAMANGEPFLNSLGSGFDADVAVRVAASPRFLPGVAGYLYAVFASLAVHACPHCRVVVDGELVHEGPTLLAGVQNGPRTGGGFMFAPTAEPDDGLLDVLVARGITRWETVLLLPRVLRGTHLGHPAIGAWRGREVTVSWQEARPCHVDGEQLPTAPEYTVSVVPGALPVLG